MCNVTSDSSSEDTSGLYKGFSQVPCVVSGWGSGTRMRARDVLPLSGNVPAEEQWLRFSCSAAPLPRTPPR